MAYSHTLSLRVTDVDRACSYDRRRSSMLSHMLLDLTLFFPLEWFQIIFPLKISYLIISRETYPIFVTSFLDYSPSILKQVCSKIFVTRSPYGKYIPFLLLAIICCITLLTQFVLVLFIITHTTATSNQVRWLKLLF